MQIGAFAKATGLTPDTIRFYVRKGLLKPRTSGKGGRNPYQIFTPEHVRDAGVIRMAQSLGMSLKEIAAINDEHPDGVVTRERSIEIMSGQLAKLEAKAGELEAMARYLRDKLAWLKSGAPAPEPDFGGRVCERYAATPAPATAFIPVIDVAAIRSGAASDLEEVGRQIFSAFTASGFCYIRNHGVPEAVITEAASTALDFFHLPLDQKQLAAPKEAVRGFNAIGRTTMRGARNPDYKEYFQIGLELAPDDPAVLAGQPLRGPNQWPAGMPGFQAALSRYFDEIALCGQGLLRAVAVSLGAAPDVFVGKYDKPLQRTQCVYYPPHPAQADADLYGVAPHTDYGCVTLLWQDGVGGLEVRDRSGAWVQAPSIAGTLVVNIGDLLARWSNDRYLSNQHRVTNRSGRERLSIVTFFDPDYSALVDPGDLGAPAGEPRRHAPVLAGDYIMGRISASQQRPGGVETRRLD